MREFKKEHLPLPKGSEGFLLPSGPVDLEIGAGVGWHGIQYFQQNPDRTLVSIERTTAKFEKYQKRYEAHGAPKNLIALQGNAQNWVAHFFPKNSVEKIFLLYPNPSPKNPSERWAKMPFMGFLLERLKSGGSLTMATNERWYYEEAKEAFLNDWDLEIVEDIILSKEFPPRTHFEQKYLARGESCHNLILRKK